MTPNEQDYTALTLVARSMGMSGDDGHYVTKTGVEIDATACKEDRLALGYLVASTLGHISYA